MHSLSSDAPPILEHVKRGIGAAGGFWAIKSELGRVANGIPDRSHRLKGLGNAVVPQIPEIIGNAILENRKNHAL